MLSTHYVVVNTNEGHNYSRMFLQTRFLEEAIIILNKLSTHAPSKHFPKITFKPSFGLPISEEFTSIHCNPSCCIVGKSGIASHCISSRIISTNEQLRNTQIIISNFNNGVEMQKLTKPNSRFLLFLFTIKPRLIYIMCTQSNLVVTCVSAVPVLNYKSLPNTTQIQARIGLKKHHRIP